MSPKQVNFGCSPDLLDPNFNPAFVHPSLWVIMYHYASGEVVFWHRFSLEDDHRFKFGSIRLQGTPIQFQFLLVFFAGLKSLFDLY